MSCRGYDAAAQALIEQLRHPYNQRDKLTRASWNKEERNAL